MYLALFHNHSCHWTDYQGICLQIITLQEPKYSKNYLTQANLIPKPLTTSIRRSSSPTISFNTDWVKTARTGANSSFQRVNLMISWLRHRIRENSPKRASLESIDKSRTKRRYSSMKRRSKYSRSLRRWLWRNTVLKSLRMRKKKVRRRWEIVQSRRVRIGASCWKKIRMSRCWIKVRRAKMVKIWNRLWKLTNNWTTASTTTNFLQNVSHQK